MNTNLENAIGRLYPHRNDAKVAEAIDAIEQGHLLRAQGCILDAYEETQRIFGDLLHGIYRDLTKAREILKEEYGRLV